MLPCSAWPSAPAWSPAATSPAPSTRSVTAESLYEAVAQALGILRGDMWVQEIREGLTELRVRVKQPAVELG
jgi:hypothetical protein